MDLLQELVKQCRAPVPDEVWVIMRKLASQDPLILRELDRIEAMERLGQEMINAAAEKEMYKEPLVDP